MNEKKSTSDLESGSETLQRNLAVFDSLLDGLAEQASDPATTAEDFFNDAYTLIDAIIAPQWRSILLAGPQGALFAIGSDANRSDSSHSSSSHSNPAANISDYVAPLWVDENSNENSSGQGSNLEKSCSKQLHLQHPDVVDSPIEVSNSTRGWIVAKIEPPQSASARDILDGVARIIADFMITQDLSQQATRQEQLRLYSTNVYSSLKTKEVANHIANDSRLLMNCERVSVYSLNRGRLRLLSISSVASVENRTELLKQQKRLVAVASQMDEPLGSDRPPPVSSRHGKAIDRLLREYQQLSDFPFLFGISLSASRTNGSYLLAESTADISRLDFAQGVAEVVPPAAVAMKNAFKHESIPFGGLLGALAGVTGMFNMSRFVFTAGILAILMAALLFVQTDFKIRIEGELRPTARRVVFAPSEGVVDQVFVGQGDLVSIDQPLIRIRSPELELSLSRTEGELQKIAKLLDSKTIALNQASSDANAAPSVIGQLSSDVSDAEFRIDSLEDERKFLLEQAGKLLVVSPIAGNVTTWKVEESLINRPVRWGDSLVTIANEEGDWELRFRVPERRIGYVLQAQGDQNNLGDQDPQERMSGRDVEFFFEANPVQKFSATIEEVGKSTESDSILGPVAVVVCSAPDDEYVRRHGARVIADIYCGKKSIMFVWTRELIDSARRKFVW